jgi:hypothetical protein
MDFYTASKSGSPGEPGSLVIAFALHFHFIGSILQHRTRLEAIDQAIL